MRGLYGRYDFTVQVSEEEFNELYPLLSECNRPGGAGTYEIQGGPQEIRGILVKGDLFYPYFYFISRIYSDGHVLSKRVLPPLAVVNPYHSERIKAHCQLCLMKSKGMRFIDTPGTIMGGKDIIKYLWA